MEYRAEGAQRFPTSYTLDALRRAMAAGDILESRALSFDSEKRLHFRLGEIEAIMPYEECADGVRVLYGHGDRRTGGRACGAALTHTGAAAL